MKEQSFTSHSRLVPGFHFFTLGMILLIIIGSVVYFYNALVTEGMRWLPAVLQLAVAIVLASFFIYIRMFALRVQDRAIRAEENLRYLALTGKLLDRRLNISQVIALRFAPDEEFTELAVMAAEKNMSATDIKKAIRQWKADHHRV